jgi:DNA polymerase-3 subunit beta
VKIKAQAGVLAKLLQIVTRAVSNRSTIQLLSAVLFEAKGGLLKMSATDMELSISVAGRTEIEEEGRTAIPARVLLEVVRSLPDGEISLRAEDGKASLAHGNNLYGFRTYDPKDFPVPAAFPSGADGSGAPSFAVPIADLADTVQKVLPCVSKDEQRPVLTGVLVSFEDGRVRMVATDAYRMAMNAASLEGAPAQAGRAIIPGRALKEVARLSELAKEVRVALTENAAMFNVGGVTLSTRLIDGNYPEYRRMLPNAFAEEFSVDRAALLDSLKRVNLFAGRQTPPVPIRLSFSHPEGTLTGGELSVSVESSETGGAVEKVAAEVEEGKEFAACFNPQYLLDGAASVPAKRVLFRLNDPQKPAVLCDGDAPEGTAPAGDTDAKPGPQKEEKEGEGAGAGSETSTTTTTTTNAVLDAPGFSYLIMPMRDPTRQKA